MSNYRIYADATADFTKEMLRELPDVKVIPMEISINGKSYFYGIDEELTPMQFYTELRNGKFATTSQINPYTYAEYFRETLKEGLDILYFCFSSALSGTKISAELAAIDLREEFPERKIIVIDTLCASLGEAMLICEAAIRQQLGMDLMEVVDWAEEYKTKVCHWFTVDNFTHLRHGGRVSAATAALGSTLNIKPILHVTAEGELRAKDKPRGRKQALKTMMKKLEEGWMPSISKQIIIGHGDAKDRAEELANMIQERYENAEILIADVGAVIGAHTGPDILTMFYWGKNR